MRMVFQCARRSRLAPALALISAFVIFCIAPSAGELSGPNDPKFLAVATPGKFQDAIRAGVQHILITEHLDMTNSPTEQDMDPEVQALNRGVGRLWETTRSIGGRCTTPPPARFNLREPVPLGACAILVVEDFLDIPVGSIQFWLDSVYVAIEDPGTSNSSVLVLHVDGDMWITNSVFQGAGNNSRACDVTSRDEGLPRMFMSDVVISGFIRDHGPGIIAWPAVSLALQSVTLRNITLLPRRSGEPVQASAITLYNGTGLQMQDVVIEDNIIYGQPAGFQGIGAAKGPPPSQVFSDEDILVFQWPDSKLRTDSLFNSTTKFGRGFLDGGIVLSGLRQERQVLMDAALGVLPPLGAPAPAPALAPVPAPEPAPTPAPDPAPAVVPMAPTPSPAAPPPQAPIPPSPPPLPQPSPLPMLPTISNDTVSGRGPNGESLSEGDPVGRDLAVGAEEEEAGGEDDDDVEVGAIVGAALAAAAAVALCVTLAALLMLRRRRRAAAQQVPPPPMHGPPPLLAEPQAAVGGWSYPRYDGK
eukprot:jgi/Ulvmu1/10419/UM062_0015.1